MVRLIYLEWHDSAGADGWHRTDDYTNGLIVVRSIGWVIEETDDHLTLVSHLGRESDRDDTTQACGWMTIPKGAITYRRDIRLKRKKDERKDLDT